MLTRTCKALDWGTGVELSATCWGRRRLQLHHVFPKALLYAHGYPRTEVNAMANFTFLTQNTNLRVLNRDPAQYLEEFVRNSLAPWTHIGSPGPNPLEDRELQELPGCACELLAQAANRFLDSLLAGALPEAEIAPSVPVPLPRAVRGGVEGEEEERVIQECNQWVVSHGLPEGEYLYELADPETREALAVFDLAWPDGLQEEYSQPVALLLDEPEEMLEIAQPVRLSLLHGCGSLPRVRGTRDPGTCAGGFIEVRGRSSTAQSAIPNGFESTS